MPNNDMISRSDFGLTVLKLAMPTLYSGTVKVDDVLDALEEAPAVSERSYPPTFNRKALEESLEYWYEHFELNNDEHNRAVWCAINTIQYCIEHDSGYQEGEENEDSQL